MPGTAPDRNAEGLTMLDLAFAALTVAVFATLWLIVKGVERFER